MRFPCNSAKLRHFLIEFRINSDSFIWRIIVRNRFIFDDNWFVFFNFSFNLRIQNLTGFFNNCFIFRGFNNIRLLLSLFWWNHLTVTENLSFLCNCLFNFFYWRFLAFNVSFLSLFSVFCFLDLFILAILDLLFLSLEFQCNLASFSFNFFLFFLQLFDSFRISGNAGSYLLFSLF